MKKQLRFLYRYFITSRRWRRWINKQMVMVVAVSGIFLTTLAWTAPLSKVDSAAIALTLTPAQTLVSKNHVGPTPSPFPAEYYTNADQTIGITLAGALLVLIVVVGVISFLPKKDSR